MATAIWTGTIGFGLVSVPVKLVSATKSKDVRFNQLEEGTNSRIRYRRVSELSGEEVPTNRIVKGHEITPGQYVVLSDDEIKSLAPTSSRTIEIEDFVDLDDIDPLYFEQPYYLAPDPKAVKPYKLLVEAMTELRKVAIGRLVMRSKESLVAIRPLDGVLCVETMRFADEVLPTEGLIPDDAEVGEPTTREMEMAKQLVQALEAVFDPEKYRDTYRDELVALIDRKAAGEEIVAEPMVEDDGKVLDLMAALEASLQRAGRAGRAGSGGGSQDGDDSEELPPAAEASEQSEASEKATKQRGARTRKSA